MDLFNGNLQNEEHKKIAADVLNKDVDDVSQEDSAMAVAMGDRLKKAFNSNSKLSKDEKKAISKAIRDLASGRYKGQNFDADAFGTRPFDVAIKSVLNQTEYNGTKIKDKNKLLSDTFKSIMIPACDRYLSIYKLLVSLPGGPTDFAGDRVASTGFESKAKNYNQQNRNVIHWEWLNNPDYKYVNDFYDEINKIANLRNDKKLSALNNGDTVSINTGNDFIHAMLRYNDDSVVLTLHDSSGSSTPTEKRMNRNIKRYGNPVLDNDNKPKKDSKGNEIYDGHIDRIYLNNSSNDAKQGLKHGLKTGDIFRKYGDSLSEYRVNQDEEGNYFIERKIKNDKGVLVSAPITIDPKDYNTMILYKE